MDVLVNKNNLLDEYYVPNNLVDISNPYYQSIVPGYSLRVVDFVYDAFKLLADEAKKVGFQLFIDSGFRSYDYQKRVLDYYLNIMGEEAYSKVALPGSSEHQTGLAIDCATLVNGDYIDELIDGMPVTCWLHENCADFGFILRYPKGKEEITGYNYEPWHLRFVGLELAQYLRANNKTLEEYYLEKDLKL